MAVEERGIVVRQSRSSFFYNYILIGLVLVFFILVWSRLGLTFTLFPRTLDSFWKSFVVLGFVGLMALLLEEPTLVRWFRYYVLTNNEVILKEGILSERKVIIPLQSLANVHVYKGVLGRLFDFGDVVVVGFKDRIIMKGIHNPELFYRIINNKISIMRGTKAAVAHEKPPVSGIKKDGDWRESERELRKEFDRRPELARRPEPVRRPESARRPRGKKAGARAGAKGIKREKKRGSVGTAGMLEIFRREQRERREAEEPEGSEVEFE